MKIIVDAMGGDNAPDVTVRGAALAAKEYGEDIPARRPARGDHRRAARAWTENTEHLTIMPASDIVDMHDDPATVLRRKPDSSMAVAFKAAQRQARAMRPLRGQYCAADRRATLPYGGRIMGYPPRGTRAWSCPARGGEVMRATPARTPSARRKCCSSSPSLASLWLRGEELTAQVAARRSGQTTAPRTPWRAIRSWAGSICAGSRPQATHLPQFRRQR